MGHVVEDGQVMTVSESREILSRVMAIVEQEAAGVLSLEAARREIQRVMRPFKRRLRRRIRHQARMIVRGLELLDGV